MCILSPFAFAQPTYEANILPLVQRLCFECHNPGKTKGDLDLQRFETQAMVTDAIAVWQRAGKRIESKEMPPKKQPQPTEEEKALLLSWIGALTPNVADCEQIASEESAAWFPGYVMSRRLNRDEYENTVQDLLGIEAELTPMFPADGAGGEGFTNNGSSLYLSAIQVEKYLQSADVAVDTLFPPTRYQPLRATGRLLSRAATFRWFPTAEEKRLRAARRQIIFEKPGDKEPREAARVVLEDFMQRAWRRPVEPQEVETLLSLFDKNYARRGGYSASLAVAFKGALISPHFVFLAETEPEQPGVYQLGDFPLAARLAYFLWGTMPDDTLTALAESGTLGEEAELRAQVERMLDDPRVLGLSEQFASQWLGISQLGETSRPDAVRFPEFDETFASTMREEAVLFFNSLIEDDHSLLALINADYTFANEKLAALYGIPDVQGEKLQRVKVADASRGGVLGMAAVLTATSHPLRTSPVLRGKWVLEQLLGDNVPPPPPDAGTLPEDDVQADGLTLRQRMEVHRERAECASCHARMDPLGFGLENFDPIGRWRVEQAGGAVDASGALPSGETFNGPAELKQILLAQKDQFARNLARKMLGYALGRPLNQYDECVINDAVAAMQANDYKPSSLITTIALSYPFRHRYSGSATDGDSAS